ncbi:MAG: hypothetical protein ABSB67_03990 [Bryobacteraceae bacterium]
MDLWIAAVVFLAAVSVLNSGLFSRKLYEDDDLAANALQVQNAKHFRELLGNYSRWNYHHPGPIALYLLAAGEGLFYDGLHVVPAPLNAELLTVIVFNTGLLFLAIALFQRSCRNLWFTPLGLVAALYFIWTVNHTVWGSAFVSAWPPHLLLFPFLVFICSCAALWSTTSRLLPLVVGAGLFLIQVHESQAPFVVVLGGAALIGAWRRETTNNPLHKVLFQRRRELLASAVIATVMSIPMVVETFIHSPNNLTKIAWYVRAHRGFGHTLSESLEYFLTFLLQVGNQENLIGKVGPLQIFPTYDYAYVYLALLLGLLAIAVGVRLKTRKPLTVFGKALLVEMLLGSLVFLLWGMEITGELYNYLGFMIFSIQLLMMWLALGYILDRVHLTTPRWAPFGVTCVAAASVIFMGPYIQSQYFGDSEVFAIANGLPAQGQNVRVDYPAKDWVRVAGVLSWMRREKKPFCTSPEAELLFGSENVCREKAASSTLLFSDQLIACPSCRTLSTAGGQFAAFMPVPRLPFPFTVGPMDLTDTPQSTDGDGQSSECLHALFSLPEAAQTGQDLQVRLTETGLPASGTKAFLNGRPLAGTSSRDTFSIPGSILSPGGENGIRICGPRTLFPAAVTASGSPSIALVDVNFKSDAPRSGFYKREPNGQWTSANASISFWLNDGEAASKSFKMTINGADLPDRPVAVGLNGHHIGQISGYIGDGVSFLVGSNTLRFGNNQLTFSVPAAAPVGNDSRALGFGFMRLRVSPLETRPLPLTLVAQDTFDVKRGFFGLDGDQRWTPGDGVIEFATSPEAGVESYRLTIEAGPLTDGDVMVLWNGSALGKLPPTGTGEFRLQAEGFEASRINRIGLVAAAGRSYGQGGARFRRAMLSPVQTITLEFAAMPGSVAGGF